MRNSGHDHSTLGSTVPQDSRLAQVPDGTQRPLWSVMIPTYNCAHYLRETLASVLAQDPGPDTMQIEVVDDCSTSDDPKAVVQELGAGRVGFFRQPKNRGHSGNFLTCLQRSRGHLVHLLHGDDFVRDGFYQRMEAGFVAAPEAGAAFCRHGYMNEAGEVFLLSDIERAESGLLKNWLERIAVRQLIQTPSIVVRREIYEVLGTFNSQLAWVEDWEMWVRIAAHYPVWYEVEPLAVYRMHGTSNTSRHIRSGENLRDVRRAVEVIGTLLPPETAAAIRRQSLYFWADDALRNRVPGFLAHGDLRTSLVQIREALLCSSSPEIVSLALRLLPVVAKVAMGKQGMRRARDGSACRPPLSRL